MLSDLTVISAGLLWLGLLFGAALWGERRAGLLSKHWGIVYALSLAVYCTSWTFYGTVTQAARSGWPVPPTFVGTILLYAFGFALLLKLVRLARSYNATSLADLIATRLGRDGWLAAAVTLVAVLGMLPYIALQLKAVAMSYGLLTRASDLAPPAWQDSALYVALAMALFAMLFGTRRASTAEHNRGLVLAMAFESLLKLGAMLALGAFVVFGLEPIAADSAFACGSAGGPECPAPVATSTAGFMPLVLLGALAMFTLPHQFHVGVVECQSERHLHTARWLFPLYMLLIALPVLPLAWAGDARLAGLGVPSDLYVLALPLSEGRDGLALLAFLGGLSAATGMVILATLALSLMIGNHWLTPLLVHAGWAQRAGHDLRGSVLRQRRVAILVVVLLAWAYSRAIVGSDALADIGAVSFSALGVLAPPLLFAIARPHTPPRAVLAGLLAAVVVWAWLLLLPALVELGTDRPDWLLHGPFGIGWLGPDGFLGFGDWSRLGRAVVFSLLAGIAVPFLLAGLVAPRGERGAPQALDVAVLRGVAQRFLPAERVERLLARQAVIGGAEAELEHELAAVLGAASARLLLDAARRENAGELDTVAEIVGEASQALRFNQQVLEAALENMTQGISVVDSELRLVAWNRRYAELFGFPAELLQVGRPIADLARHALRENLATDPAQIEAMLVRRLDHMRAGSPHLTERRMRDGSIIEIRGNPMPGGGFVATYTDVTAFRHGEAELKRAAETLEQRVADRTAALAQATRAAERANLAKSRFLAAISHDLAQPLNAAHLFTHALAQRLDGSPDAEAVANIDGALGSAEGLLSELLDISRLDAGGLVPKRQPFDAADLLRHLAAEFGVLAGDKGLEMRCVVPKSVWLDSDSQLLRRVLQNFLANAVRYTPRGRVLLGCRRAAGHLRIEVWDTGPGIAEHDQSLIFEEFRRLSHGGQGLGLGLAIAERIARLLGHPLSLRSIPGRGTVFAIEVPTCAAPQPTAAAPRSELDAVPQRQRVLVVDNHAAVLRGMQALLDGWNCEVLPAQGFADALRLAESGRPALFLLDYHLDDGRTGLELRRELAARIGERPTILISADHGEALRRDAAAAGCHLLHKPLKPLALKALMARIGAQAGVPA
jgi:PAS domain S-box-containing protein